MGFILDTRIRVHTDILMCMYVYVHEPCFQHGSCLRAMLENVLLSIVFANMAR